MIANSAHVEILYLAVSATELLWACKSIKACLFGKVFHLSKQSLPSSFGKPWLLHCVLEASWRRSKNQMLSSLCCNDTIPSLMKSSIRDKESFISVSSSKYMVVDVEMPISRLSFLAERCVGKVLSTKSNCHITLTINFVSNKYENVHLEHKIS